MNCKPGDLAVVVTDDCGFEENIGLMVIVIKDAGPWPFDSRFHWLCEAIGRPMKNMLTDENNMPAEGFCYEKHGEWPDCCLRPIRPQSDDATDESLLWLPLPKKEETTA